MCTLQVTLLPFVGYRLVGSCLGQDGKPRTHSLTFGVNEALTPERLPDGACDAYRAEALRCYGPGGPRTLDKPLPWPPHEREDLPPELAERTFFDVSMLGRPRDPTGF